MTEAEKKFILADETFDVWEVLERGCELFSDFMELYIESEKAQTNLIFEMQNRPQRISAKMFTLYEMFLNARDDLGAFQNVQ